jgi:hypothetical protein
MDDGWTHGGSLRANLRTNAARSRRIGADRRPDVADTARREVYKNCGLAAAGRYRAKAMIQKKLTIEGFRVGRVVRGEGSRSELKLPTSLALSRKRERASRQEA